MFEDCAIVVGCHCEAGVEESICASIRYLLYTSVSFDYKHVCVTEDVVTLVEQLATAGSRHVALDTV